MNIIKNRLIRKADGEYSYDTLMNATDDDLIQKLNNAQALNGTWASLDNTQKNDLSQRMIKLFQDNKGKILSMYDNINQGQAAAQQTLFNTMNISDKLDKECFQKLKVAAGNGNNDDGTVDVATKISNWTHEHTNTTVNEFQQFINSLNVSKNDINQSFNRAIQSGNISQKDADVILQGLNQLTW